MKQQQIIDAWNAQADEANQWGALGEDEKLTWAFKCALAKSEQEPVAWKLVPIEPTREMLDAMDECSMEGYDERLYAGHAASVYMAAVDVAPSPPQPKEPEQEPVAYELADKVRTDLDRQSCPGVFMNIAWESIVKNYTTPPQRKPLTDEQIAELCRSLPATQYTIAFARAIEAAHGIKE